MKMAETAYMVIGPIVAPVSKIAVGGEAPGPGIGTKLDKAERNQRSREPLAMVTLGTDEWINVIDGTFRFA
jgi:hypothetical protein